MKKAKYPAKTSMNLYYKPDRTTKPSTTALYVLFILVLLLGVAKWMVYDLWTEKQAAERTLSMAQDELNDVMLQVADYDEVHQRYVRYSATDEELNLVKRVEVLDMLDGAVGNAEMSSISISGMQVSLQISDVTLTELAEIVSRMERSSIVASTTVNTAATSGDNRGMNTDLVHASVVVQLEKPVEEEMEAAQ